MEACLQRRTPQWASAETAVRCIKKGKRIFIGSGCAEPQHLVGALVNNAAHFHDNEIVHLLTLGIAPYADPKYSRAFRHNAFFIGPNVRGAITEGHADYTPIFLSEIPALFKTKQMPIHCALIQVSPPDEEGYVSLGVSVDVIPAAAAGAELVIAQVNSFMPQTCGQSKIPLSAVDFLVKADEPLIELSKDGPDEVSLQIGRHLARHIKDGDTLQLGIGRIPDALSAHLTDKHDLGIHSEMISDGVIKLYKNGNITNRNKGFNEGASVVSFVMGTRQLYELVDRNPEFQFYPSEYVNDPWIVSQNQNMVSINSAIQIDLTGQVCADSLGSRFYSGFGGQVDFVRGARRSKGGRSFIAFPSTAKDGAVSRIVPTLSEGAGVVTSRADVDYVATEFGVAYLHGKTIRERGLALVQIAHPKFRDELLDYLKQKHYVYLDQKTIKDDHSPVKELIPFSRTFNEKTIYFRSLRPHDEKAIQDFFYSHEACTIYNRYLEYVEALPHAEAWKRASVDYNKDMAIAGFDSLEPYAQMVCIGRYICQEDGCAEIGIVVKEEYHGQGIGGFLLERLIEAGRRHGLTKLVAYVGTSNVPMLRIFKKYGFAIKESARIEGFHVSLDLAPHPAETSLVY